MTFLTPLPAIIAAAIALPVLVLLYFLKLRRQPTPVSSTLLWKKSIHDLQVNTPFQKLRRNLLLLLQLLLLASIILALARPTMQATQTLSNQTVIVIDHSASMNAHTPAPGSTPTRLGNAKQIATQLIDSVNSTASRESDQPVGAIMIVSFANRARVVQPFTNDKSRLRSAIATITPTDQLSHLDQALQLIEPYAQQPTTSQSNITVYILSDGQLQQSTSTIAHTANLDLRYIPIPTPSTTGTSATEIHNNLAFTTLAARRDEQNPAQVRIYTNLASSSSQQVSANITLRIDDQIQKITPVTIPPAAVGSEPAQTSVEFELAIPSQAIITLSHDYQDQLVADNFASLVMTPPTQLRILLISRGNTFLTQALHAAGNNHITTKPPGWYELTDPLRLVRQQNDGYDIIIFDRYSPQNQPPTASMYFAAAPPLQGLRLLRDDTQSQTRNVILDWSRDHPAMRYVALQNVILANTPWLSLPPQAKTLAIAQPGPVIATLQSHKQTHLIVSFDILDTNWPMQTSFPVFIANAVEYLAASRRGNLGLQYQTGDVISVLTNKPDNQTITYRSPHDLTLTAAASQAEATLPMFKTVGLYHCPDVSPLFQNIAVNLLDITESDLRPASKIQIGSTNNRSNIAASAAIIQREIWQYFVAAAVVILMIEWLIYTRRMHL